MSDGPRDPGAVDGPTDGSADTPPDVEPPDVETLTAPVERRIVAVGSKSEREATVAIIDDRPLVLRHRGGAYNDPADLAALAGHTAASPAPDSRPSSWWTRPWRSDRARR